MQMQVNNTTSTQNFGSTRINLKKLDPKKPITEITDTLNKYFEIKGLGNANDVFTKNPQKITNEIDFSQAAVTLDKGDMVIIGKDGGMGGADNFIGRIMKEKFGDAVTFTEDIAPIKLDGPVIDMTKIRG